MGTKTCFWAENLSRRRRRRRNGKYIAMLSCDPYVIVLLYIQGHLYEFSFQLFGMICAAVLMTRRSQDVGYNVLVEPDGLRVWALRWLRWAVVDSERSWHFTHYLFIELLQCSVCVNCFVKSVVASSNMLYLELVVGLVTSMVPLQKCAENWSVWLPWVEVKMAKCGILLRFGFCCWVLPWHFPEYLFWLFQSVCSLCLVRHFTVLACLIWIFLFRINWFLFLDDNLKMSLPKSVYVILFLFISLLL